jgi:antitoxin HigA-1
MLGNMALRLEKAFGVRMDTLMRMRATASYDIARTRQREKSITRTSVPKTPRARI